jgi:CheY-like chemotaxis protein
MESVEKINCAIGDKQSMATRILVVNDTQTILELFQLILEGEGYEMVASSTPIHHPGEIERVNPDLIIIDIMFNQDKEGWQMIQMLKMQRSTASIPLVVCTAAVEAVRETEGHLFAKCVLVVYKPFDVDDLLATIKQALDSRNHIISLREDNEQAKKT